MTVAKTEVDVKFLPSELIMVAKRRLEMMNSNPSLTPREHVERTIFLLEEWLKSYDKAIEERKAIVNERV